MRVICEEEKANHGKISGLAFFADKFSVQSLCIFVIYKSGIGGNAEAGVQETEGNICILTLDTNCCKIKTANKICLVKGELSWQFMYLTKRRDV